MSVYPKKRMSERPYQNQVDDDIDTEGIDTMWVSNDYMSME